mgnify:CR=1 FL=1
MNSCGHFVHENSSFWVNFCGHVLGKFFWIFLVNFLGHFSVMAMPHLMNSHLCKTLHCNPLQGNYRVELLHREIPVVITGNEFT